MSDFAEAAAGLADGAIAARVVEPRAGEGGTADGHTHESACLNCGTELVGPHCHRCGQRGHVHRTLGAFFHDLLHGVLHFEGKTWRTIPLLVWKPGKLTRDYIDGKRASYVSPIALFLFVVFLSFALYNALGGAVSTPTAASLDEAKVAFRQNEAQLANLKKQRETAKGQAREKIDEKIDSLQEDQDSMREVLGSVSSGFSDGMAQNPIPKESSLGKVVEQVKENPQLALYKVQTNAYKYSWMLIPLSVPFVWLLFPFSRRFGAYDHTVFTTYSITFMIALVAVAGVLFYAGAGAIGGLLLFYAPYHLYRQLRGAYEVSRFGALWRMLVLSIFAWVAIGLFAAVISWMASAH